MREKIQQEMEQFIADYRRETGIETDWKKPLIGFADAFHPVIRSLRELVSETHYMPEDILPEPTVILAYFLPFREDIGRSNAEGELPSKMWAQAYTDTNTMFPLLNRRLQRVIEGWGYRAATPEGIGTLGPDRIYSNWSQRHIAYAAGLGTFGVNNMLITKEGCCGRYFTLVTDLPVSPDRPIEEENCLYKRNGGCGLCLRRCPAGALHCNAPFDRAACYEQLRSNETDFSEKVCGKCVVGLPCTFRAP